MDYDALAGELGGQAAAPPTVNYDALAGELGGKPADLSVMDKVARKAKVAGSAILKGLLSIPALMADSNAPPLMADLASNYTEPQTRPSPELSKKLTGVGPKPEGAGEKYLSSTLEGAAANLPFGGASLAIRALIGAASGMGSEAAANVAGEGFLPRLLGGLAGGGIASGATALKKTRESLAKEALHDVTDADLVAAKKAQIDSQVQGVPLMLNQAMGKDSNLDKLTDRLAQSKAGVETTRLLRNQPDDVSFGMEREVNALPGDVRSKQIAANNLQQAATDALQAKRDVRGKAWEETVANTIADLKAAREPAVADAKAALLPESAVYKEAQQRVKEAKANFAAAKKEDVVVYQALKDKLAREQGTLNELNKFVKTTGGKSNLSMEGSGFGTEDTFIKGQAKAASDFLATPTVQGKPVLELSPKTQALAGEVADRGANLEAVKGSVEAAKGKLQIAQNELRAVTEVPAQTIVDASDNLRRIASKYPNTPRETALNRLAGALFIDGKPITNPAAINEILKTEANKLKSTTLADSGIDIGTAKWLGTQINGVREKLGTTFEPVRKANEVYRRLTLEEINPLKQSIIGDLAGRRGAIPDANAAKTKFLTLFNEGTDPKSKVSDILDLEKGVRNLPDGPATYQDAVKTWLSDTISGATQQKGGQLSENIASNIEQALLANPKKQQGLKDALVGLARSEGKSEDTYLGMQNFLRIVSAAAKRPGSVTGTSVTDLENASRSKLLGGLSRLTAIQPLRQPFKALDDALNRDAYGFMDKLLTSPEGVDMLRKLNKQPVMSKAAADTVATFAATYANSHDK